MRTATRSLSSVYTSLPHSCRARTCRLLLVRQCAGMRTCKQHSRRGSGRLGRATSEPGQLVVHVADGWGAGHEQAAGAVRNERQHKWCLLGPQLFSDTAVACTASSNSAGANGSGGRGNSSTIGKQARAAAGNQHQQAHLHRLADAVLGVVGAQVAQRLALLVHQHGQPRACSSQCVQAGSMQNSAAACQQPRAGAGSSCRRVQPGGSCASSKAECRQSGLAVLCLRGRRSKRRCANSSWPGCMNLHASRPPELSGAGTR